MSKLNHTPVIFKDADGNLITNDPVVRAHQTLGHDISEFLVEEPTSAGVGQIPAGTPDDEEIDTDPYTAMSGAELKEEAKKRSVDIKGLTRVGQVRDALRAADEAEAAKTAGQGESDDDEADDEE